MDEDKKCCDDLRRKAAQSSQSSQSFVIIFARAWVSFKRPSQKKTLFHELSLPCLEKSSNFSKNFSQNI